MCWDHCGSPVIMFLAAGHALVWVAVAKINLVLLTSYMNSSSNYIFDDREVKDCISSPKM